MKRAVSLLAVSAILSGSALADTSGYLETWHEALALSESGIAYIEEETCSGLANAVEVYGQALNLLNAVRQSVDADAGLTDEERASFEVLDLHIQVASENYNDVGVAHFNQCRPYSMGDSDGDGENDDGEDDPFNTEW